MHADHKESGKQSASNVDGLLPPLYNNKGIIFNYFFASSSLDSPLVLSSLDCPLKSRAKIRNRELVVSWSI